DLVLRLERALPGPAQLRRLRQLRRGAHRPGPAQVGVDDRPAHRHRGAGQPAARAAARAAAGPALPRPGRRADDADRPVPAGADRRRADVEAPAVQPGVRAVQRHPERRRRGRAPQPDWISEMPLMAVEAALIWQWTPFMMLILLAGLQSRDPQLVEAARMDGASDWQVFVHITLPHLRRYLELGVLLGSIYIVQNFDAVFTITSGGLGTANLPYTIYQTFYQAHENGLASAAGVIVVLGSLVLAT